MGLGRGGLCFPMPHDLDVSPIGDSTTSSTVYEQSKVYLQRRAEKDWGDGDRSEEGGGAINTF